jgi:hypothetical protein
MLVIHQLNGNSQFITKRASTCGELYQRLRGVVAQVDFETKI